MSVTAGLIAGLGSAAAGLIGSAFNWWQGSKNRDFQEEMNARNEALTREAWARDDNAVQRRVADLKAAGLSPVLAAGSAASTSAPIANSSRDVDYGSLSNPVIDALSAIQMKSNIDSTNAGRALTNFQSQTEQWKQSLMQEQVNKTIAETVQLDKQNNIFDLDAMSKINLRNKQAQHLIDSSELLKAETVFKQTELDKLKTEIDTEKIMRDFRNFQLTTAGLKLYNDTWSVNKGLIGKMFGDFRTPFSSFDIRHAINNIDRSGYWDNNE